MRNLINICCIKLEYILGNFKAKILLQKVGKKCHLSKSIKYLNPSNIHIADDVEVKEYSTLDARTNSNIGINIGKQCRIKENVALICYSGFVNIQNNVLIGRNTVVLAHGGVEIGEKTLIGPNCLIVASNHICSLNNIDFQEQGFTKQKIKIGRNVWIGGGSKILGGTIINDNVVIAAGSVVPKMTLDSGFIYSGVPAEKKRTLKEKEFESEEVYYKNWDTYI
ncbi:MAG: acyltransferase [Fibromonadaceae bacterium]|jgi:acetyltransferase-like isoleucine patch superfamily enzyme|nr:acyltransferase [Fibromonadaceae bacterium]